MRGVATRLVLGAVLIATAGALALGWVPQRVS